MNFENRLKNDWLLLDGAMGTELQKKGLNLGQIPESLNLEYPEILTEIHRSYVEAGSQIISTNTFGASPYKLENSGYTVKEIIESGILLAKAANPEFVALDLGPIGRMMAPIGDMTFEEAYEAYKIQVAYSQGADLVLIETLSDLNEARAAVLAVKENTDLPVIVSMTFQEDQRTLTGVTPEVFVYTLEALGVSALGVNCSLGPEALKPIVDRIVKIASVPIIVQGNAGMPEVINGVTTFSVRPKSYSHYGLSFLESGVRLIGGCCGTTPEHIKELSQLELKVAKNIIKKETVLCSSTKVVPFEDFMIIGERINPTGHKKLKQALREGNIDYCIKEGIEQAEAGAQILDVNVGLPDIDEYQMMIDVVDALTVAVDTPLQIDSSNVKVLEAGLRRFPGVAIVNSVNGKESSMDEIFPIVKKYGAMVVCLTLDEEGIPKNSEARYEIAKKIIETAKSYGIPEENLIIDTLVLTVSAQQKEVLETLKAIQAIKAEYKVKTTLGISNVSYGMPNRPLLTRTFMTLAIAHGLDSAIMDPKDEALKNVILSTRVLMNQDIDGSEYIDYIHTPEKVVEKSKEQDFFDLVLKGYKNEVGLQTKIWLESLSPLAIVNDHLIKTLDLIGQRYEEKSIFLPQLMRAAETIGVAFDVIKSALPDQSEVVSKGKIILATVQGDVHDIGKNLVKMLLENYGFDVVDLGKDVSPEKVLEKVIDTNIKLVGLSALMTTTVVSMANTIKLLKSHNPEIKIFVGGAVLSESYAKEINADDYCKDGKASVLVAQSYYENKNMSNL